MVHQDLQKNIWSKNQYYQKISSIDDFSHPALKKIFSQTKDSRTILDVGCGDGSKLKLMGSPRTIKYGLEVSAHIVSLAKHKHPSFHFLKAQGEKIPFEDNSFETVTCLFVLEHVNKASEVVSEIIRVTAPLGKFYLLAPNFGAPNRASPNFLGSRLSKLIKGFVTDFIYDSSLNWKTVEPRVQSIAQFEPDLDTTTEPYLRSLISFLKSFPVTIVEANSYWEMELPTTKKIQKVFSYFGKLGIFPFKYWGPHMFLIGQKNSF